MINFLKYKKIYFALSAIIIGIGLYSILVWGYRFSIDFVGGVNFDLELNRPITSAALSQATKKNEIELVEYKIEGKTLALRAKTMTEKKESSLKSDLEKATGGKATVLKLETVGPALGAETMRKTILASILAIIGILIYMSISFKGFKFALSAILAMIHDFLIMIGSYSLLSHFFGAEVDLLFVTALLTTMSFSVHDTIVIFDKIREYVRTEGNSNIEYYANKALTETMVRSINNSMTIIFMLLSLSLLGGASIRFFVITLLIGTITGTYSSPFIATPILVWLEKRNIKNS